MAAPSNNQYYLLRSKDGRETIYTPIELLEKANEYFTWCLNNPLYEEQLFHYQGAITRDKVSKIRAFSLEGFCNYAEIVVNTFKNYENKEDFLTVTTRIRQIIDSQQFEGAASGFLNPNIIARKLGLVDRKEQNVKGLDLGKAYESEYEE